MRKSITFIVVHVFTRARSGNTVGFSQTVQYKNANITNFVLAMPMTMNKTIEICNLEM